jgi:hypothetical protein
LSYMTAAIYTPSGCVLMSMPSRLLDVEMTVTPEAEMILTGV